ncbi:CBS domain-containing protein [Streptomyces sp. NPDC085466]|uniref:CBS domain-containing protein n=1 Tax=Streptomyces sp. NPDC085466 TaxID=3365725 RepID=UPI0037D91E7B
MSTARDIMTPDVTCVRSDESVADAARKMVELDVGALPVRGPDERLKGMLTDRDIVVRVVAEGRDPAACTAGELVRGELVTVGADDPLQRVLELMADRRIRRVPVIDGDVLVGIIAQADVARRLPDSTVGDLVADVSRPPA